MGHANVMSIADRIEEARKEAGLTVEELAQEAGSTSRTGYRWVNGESELRDKKLRRISDALGVRYEWLKTGEGEMQQKTPATQ